MATHDWNPEAHGCEKLRYSKYKIVHVINWESHEDDVRGNGGKRPCI
jgi:hypothetical protein